ncbi:MAG: hypothetical protein ABIG44_14340 [Planctomycetota bacterium]
MIGKQRNSIFLIFLGALSIPISTLQPAFADVPVVTILADFEDDSVAARIGEVRGVLRSDCTVQRDVVPARGQASLAMEIGATASNVSACCDLRFRESPRLSQADRIAAFCWLKKGEYQLAYRIRDARGQLFETRPMTVQTHNRWVRIAADLAPAELVRVSGAADLEWPIEIQGYRVTTAQLGRQSIYLDDLQIEHRVPNSDVITGEIVFDEPTRIYEPGSIIGAAVWLENRSREQALRISVELAWMRPDGAVLKTQRGSVTLPASGRDFRSRQPVDFSQRISQPGLYRLVARARGSDWSRPKVIETCIAVTPSNRLIARGRSTLFGVRSGLLREPPVDQWLEIAIARDIGVHVLALETPWRMIEPSDGRFDFSGLNPVINTLVDMGIVPLVILREAPDFVSVASQRTARLTTVLEQLVRNCGPKVAHFQIGADVLPTDDLPALDAALQDILMKVRRIRPEVRLISPPLALDDPSRYAELAELLRAETDVQWCLRTTGDSANALVRLDRFRESADLTWQSKYWWQHEGWSSVGHQEMDAAQDILRHYVQAALQGIAGMIWCDLRDFDNDPAHPERMRGLVHRDFSPKAGLLGYATAAGQLTGLTCRGPVSGAPAAFDSALFIGSDRHVAVLMPRANHIRPALLAPILGVAGELTVRDFERRQRAILTSDHGTLIPTIPQPLFLSLSLDNPQPEPQLAFAEPWIQMPASVFLSENASLSIGLRINQRVRRGSVRLIIPDDVPLTAEPKRHNFKADAGDTQSFSFKLGTDSPEFQSANLIARIYLDGRKTEVPFEVRRK